MVRTWIQLARLRHIISYASWVLLISRIKFTSADLSYGTQLTVKDSADMQDFVKVLTDQLADRAFQAWQSQRSCLDQITLGKTERGSFNCRSSVPPCIRTFGVQSLTCGHRASRLQLSKQRTPFTPERVWQHRSPLDGFHLGTQRLRLRAASEETSDNADNRTNPFGSVGDSYDPIREKAGNWLAMCSAIKLSEREGLQPFSIPRAWGAFISRPCAQEYTQDELKAEINRQEPALMELIDTCRNRAPILYKKSRLLPLLLARLASWTSDQWIRPVNDWPGEAADDATTEHHEMATLRSLTAHLLENFDVPFALHGALTYVDGPPVSEAAHRVSKAFLDVQIAAGRGDSVLTSLRSAVSPSVSKAAVKEFVQLDPKELGGNRTNPLHALRRAQIASRGGAEWVADAACDSRLGQTILPSNGRGPTEEFALIALDWVCRHQEELMTPYRVTSIIDFFLEMKTVDENYTCVGRTPKTVNAALEAYVASTFSFEGMDDERFQPNPRGLRGFFELSATIPNGTRVFIPYLNMVEELGGPDQPGSKASVVRITEILSLRRLMYEGRQLDNCLEGKANSIIKYLSRARQRVSSFWSLTKQESGGDVEHLALVEVWHVADGNEVRQAEGPRPRTIPSGEAWYWMVKWCERTGIDISTWDCYS